MATPKYPMAHRIIKPNGDWNPAANTDVAATFQRERERLAALAAPKQNVRSIKARK